MRTTRIVLSLIVLATLWGADVFAHVFADDKPIKHFTPGTAGDPCEDTGCKVGSDYDGGHGHIDRTHDGTADGEAKSWGYWTCGGYKAAYSSEQDPNGEYLPAETCPDDNNGGGNGGNGGNPNPNLNPGPNPNLPPAVTTKLVKISGDGQQGLINKELTNPHHSS